nr:sodium/substrate symporter small subunit [Bordetella genomosp. 9]
MAHMPTSRTHDSGRDSAGNTSGPSWASNVRRIAVLLALWAALTILPVYFGPRLSFSFLGWPFSYWMAAYGVPLAFLLIVVGYAAIMNGAGDTD